MSKMDIPGKAERMAARSERKATREDARAERIASRPAKRDRPDNFGSHDRPNNPRNPRKVEDPMPPMKTNAPGAPMGPNVQMNPGRRPMPQMAPGAEPQGMGRMAGGAAPSRRGGPAAPGPVGQSFGAAGAMPPMAPGIEPRGMLASMPNLSSLPAKMPYVNSGSTPPGKPAMLPTGPDPMPGNLGQPTINPMIGSPPLPTPAARLPAGNSGVATMKKGGAVKKMAKGGLVRGTGCATRGNKPAKIY